MKAPKYSLGSKVWAIYPTNGWTDALHMSPTTVVGISVSLSETRYEIENSTRNGFSGYCNIPETYLFDTQADALANLREVKLRSLKERLISYEQINDKLRDEIHHQEQEIEEWSRESNS